MTNEKKMQGINIPPSIHAKRQRHLHLQPNHPLCIVKQKIYNYFGTNFQIFDELEAVVTTQANFDDLLIPAHHPCRKLTDTYYVDETHVLRTQTSAHQTELLRKGYEQFLVTGDVFRKDEVNRTHYPVFHQMEGMCLKDKSTWETQEVVSDLHATMTGLMNYLFPHCAVRINPDYFPFTDPSFEVEVEYQGQWLEVAGCGVVQSPILESVGMEKKTGWAFGLGLERLAMILFTIPDIRLFWSQDPKFTTQFQAGTITTFKPFSALDPLSRDISFFIKNTSAESKVEEWKDVNEFYDLCRDVVGDWLERVECFDQFFHGKQKLVSHAYRLTYSPPDSLTDPGTFTNKVNALHAQLYTAVNEKLEVIVR